MEIDSPTDTFWKNGPGSLPEANQELLKAAGYLQSGTAGGGGHQYITGFCREFFNFGKKVWKNRYNTQFYNRTVGQSLVILL